MTAWYNEIDPFAAAWLEALIEAGHIAPGVVDRRDIRDVKPNDLQGYDQCHFFAGIGVWSYALRRAGVPDTAKIWTGSCPCQPFSAAGQRGGFDDERHLWPAFDHLIGVCRPDFVLGEQVASKGGLAWLDLVHADLEGKSYAVGAVDLFAAGIGAPHIRQRLWWVASLLDHATDPRHNSQGQHERRSPLQSARFEQSGFTGNMADADGGYSSTERQQCSRQQRLPQGCGADNMADALGVGREQRRARADGRLAVASSGMVDAESEQEGLPGRPWEPRGTVGQPTSGGQQWQRDQPEHQQPMQTGAYERFEWLPCVDGKTRPTQPGLFPLAHGAPARVGRLRGYGNAINAEAATEFIKAALTGTANLV